MHLLLRQDDVSPPHILVAVELDLLVDRGKGRNEDLPSSLLPSAGLGVSVEHIQHLHLHCQIGVGVVVYVYRSHVGLLLLPVQLLHLELTAFVNVDRLLVDHGGCREGIHLPDHAWLGFGHINDHHVVARRRPQRNLLRRVALAHPVPGVLHPVQHALFLQVGEDLLRGLHAKLLSGLERKLKGGAFDVARQDQEVVGVDEGPLGRLAEEVIWVVHDVLVQWAGARNQHSAGDIVPAACPSRLLPGAGDGSGIPAHDAGVQLADVDPQLQGVGRDHAPHLPLSKATLDLPPLLGKVAPPVAANSAISRRTRAQVVHQIGKEELSGGARSGEDDGLDVVLDEVRGHPPRLVDHRAPDPQLGIHDGRVVKDEVLPAFGGAVVVDHDYLFLHQSGGQLLGVGDGGRRQDEHRVRSVEPADPLEPPDHVGQMAPEDAAVLVDFVDYHKAQVLEEAHPLRVMRKDAGVKHVGIGDHDVAHGSDRLPRADRRVAIVGVSLDVGPQIRDQTVKLVELVL